MTFDLYILHQQKRNKVYSKILSLKPPNLIYTVSRSPAEMLRASGLTKVTMATCEAELSFFHVHYIQSCAFCKYIFVPFLICPNFILKFTVYLDKPMCT